MENTQNRALGVFPAGISNGEYGLPEERIVVIEKGVGSRLWDRKGTEFLDFSRYCHWEGFDSLPVARNLCGGNLTSAVLAQFLISRIRASLELEPRHYLFTVHL